MVIGHLSGSSTRELNAMALPDGHFLDVIASSMRRGKTTAKARVY
jgi:hypothetical protein